MPAEPLDPRLHPYKRDVAAKHLEGQVQSDSFVDGVLHQVGKPITDILSDEGGQSRTSQALYGEPFMVYQTKGDWAWGQLLTDNYVGWISKSALSSAGEEMPTHRIVVPLTRATDNSIKVLGAGPLPMGARVHVSDRAIEIGGSSATFMQTDFGAIPASHLTPLDHTVPDWPAVAETFLHTPYVWGGRSGTGIDCSALVQLALQQAGVACPRDSDMQEQTLGLPVDRGEVLRRGDLVFWPGHVGVMMGETNLLHANAYAMSTAVEPLSAVEARVGVARTIKRLN